MKKYNTMLTKKYVPDWTIENGVREFIANALDSPSTFEYTIGRNFIELTSKGVHLEPTVLALGVSGNRLDKAAVGQHGEGILIGLIPLLRAGLNVEFRNGDVLWTPMFEYDEDLKVEVLVIIETERPFDLDYTVFIEGLSESHIQGIKHDCLYLQEDLGEVREGSIGRVLVDRPNKLYVGGLYVTDIFGHKYSYDFAPAYLPLNRDRKSVDSWNLAANTTKLLEEAFPAKEVAEMVRDRVRDTGGYYATIKSQPIAQEAYNLVKEKYGEDVVIADGSDEADLLKTSGYENVEVIYDGNYRQLVKSSVEYQSNIKKLEEGIPKIEEDKRTPVEMLNDWYEDIANALNREDRDAFFDILEVFSERGVLFQRKVRIVTASTTLGEGEEIPF